MQLADVARSTRGRVALVALVSLLCSPALFTGLVLDDFFLAMRLLSADGAIRWQGLLDAFSFVPAAELDELLELGVIPWWHDPTFQLSFFRPLSALSHALDFWLFSAAPWLMHLESLAFLAALQLAVASFYRRLFADQPRVFALAFTLYALSPGHAFAASWLANRNACLAVLFAVLCLLAHAHAHARARREKRYHALSLLALLLSLASAELGLATLALLVAHALCLDDGSPRQRLLALLPALVVTGTWLVAYRALGYGVRSCSLYVDIAHDPIAFARALFVHLPILLFGQWGLPIISFTGLCARPALWGLWLVSLAVLALFVPTVLRVLREDARARFGALASLLALLPVAATIPHDRLLTIADVGGMAALALVVDRLWDARGVHALLVRGLVRTRVVASLLLIPAYALSLFQHVEVADRPFRGILLEPEVAAQTVVFVNAPCTHFPAFLPLTRLVRDDGPVPPRIRTLAPGLYPLELERTRPDELVIRSLRGFLQPLGTWRGEGRGPGPISPVYMAQLLNQYARSDRPFRVGERVQLSDVSMRIEALTPDGYPSAVRYRFAAPLESARFRFVQARAGAYVPFVPPALGTRVRLAAQLE